MYYNIQCSTFQDNIYLNVCLIALFERLVPLLTRLLVIPRVIQTFLLVLGPRGKQIFFGGITLGAVCLHIKKYIKF